VGRKRRSRWEGGGEENKAISEAIASFTGSAAALTPEQQRQLKDQQEVGGARGGERTGGDAVSHLYCVVTADGSPSGGHSSCCCSE